MELNKVIYLKPVPFDVSELGRDQRILYFKEQERIIIKSCSRLAKLDNQTRWNNYAEVLTASQASRRYPQVFTNSTRRTFDGDTRTIVLRVPQDLYIFCCKQGNITAYLRALIEKDMKRQNDKRRSSTDSRTANHTR